MRIGLCIDIGRQVSGIAMCGAALLRELPVADSSLTIVYGTGRSFDPPLRPGARSICLRKVPGVPTTLRKSLYLATKRLDCDVVHEGTNLGFLLPCRSPFKKVVELHDVIAASSSSFAHRVPAWYRPAQHRALRAADAIIAASNFTVSEARRLYPDIPAERYTVVYRGYDAERYQPQTQADDAMLAAAGEPGYLLFVGMISPRKNLARCLAALALARQRCPDARLVVVGAHGWGCDTLLREMATGAYPGVTYLGEVAAARLPALYRGARALLWPSLYEGFGIPILEAMACGTPVISANRTATAETAGDAALLVDPENTLAITDAIVRVYREPRLTEELRAAGLARCRPFTWRRYAGEIYAVYQRLTEKALAG